MNKKRSLVISLLFLLIINTAYASQIDWTHDVGGALQFSASGDGTFIVGGSGTNLVALDDSGSILWQKTLSGGAVTSIAVSDDGNFVAVAKTKDSSLNITQDDEVILYYDSAGNLLWRYLNFLSFSKVDIADDGSKVLAVDSGFGLYVFDTDFTYRSCVGNRTGLLSDFQDVNGTLVLADIISGVTNLIDMSGDGFYAVSGSSSGDVKLITPNSRIVNVCGFGGGIPLPGSNVVQTWNLGAEVDDVSFSDSTIFAAGADNGNVQVYSTIGPSIKGSVTVGTHLNKGVISLDLNPLGNTISVLDVDGFFRFYSIGGFGLTLLREAFGATANPSNFDQLSLDSAGRFAAYLGKDGSNDQAVTFLDREAGDIPPQFLLNPSHLVRVWDEKLTDFGRKVQITDDGSSIISGASDGVLTYYHTQPDGDYALSLTASPVLLSQGGPLFFTSINVTSLNGFNDSIVSVKDLSWVGTQPAGISVILSTGTGTIVRENLNGRLDFQFDEGANTLQGNYTLRATTVSGQLEHVIDIPVIVSGPPEFILEVNGSHVVLLAAAQQEVTLPFKVTFLGGTQPLSAGMIGASGWVGGQPQWGSASPSPQVFSQMQSGETREGNLTFRVSSEAQVPGNFTYRLDVTGSSVFYPDGVSARNPHFVTVKIIDPTPDTLDIFQIDPIATQAESIPFDITVRALDGQGNPSTYTGNAFLSVQTGGIAVSPTSTPNFVNGEVTFPITLSAASNGVTLRASRFISGRTVEGLSNSFDVISGPDFGISANPSSISMELGSLANSSITLNSLVGFSGLVSLSGAWVGTTPNGMSVSFPANVNLAAGLTGSFDAVFAASAIGSTGSFTYKITGSSGGKTHSADIIVNVNPVDFNPRISALEQWRNSVEILFIDVSNLFGVGSFFDVFTEIRNDIQNLQNQQQGKVDWNNITGIPLDIADGDDNTQRSDAEIIGVVEGGFVTTDAFKTGVSNLNTELDSETAARTGNDTELQNQLDNLTSTFGSVRGETFMQFSSLLDQMNPESELPFDAMQPVACGNQLNNISLTFAADGDGLGQVIGFSGKESISGLFEYLIAVRTTDKLSIPGIVGSAGTLTYSRPGHLTHFNGIITEFGLAAFDGEYATYVARLVPSLDVLTFKSNYRIFQESTVNDVLTSLFDENGISSFNFNLNKQYPSREFVVQYRETDFNFLSRLMENEGIFYFFQHEDGDHTMVIADSNQAFGSASDVPLEYRSHEAQPESAGEEFVRTFHLKNEEFTGKVSLRDYDFKDPSNLIEGNHSSSNPSARGEAYEYGGNFIDSPDAQKLSQDRLQALESQSKRYTGTSTSGDLRAGHGIRLDDFEDMFDGDYYVTQVRHGGMLTEGQETCFAYGNEFEVIPDSVIYKPARVTPIPMVEGVTTAVVTGPSGQEIHTDEFGRVKVQFHWDREGQKDDPSSSWMRVASPFASKNYGMIFLPRIGDEVIVSFIEGDINQPIIIGSVYNAENMPPESLPDNADPSAAGTIKGNTKFIGDTHLTGEATLDGGQVVAGNVTVGDTLVLDGNVLVAGDTNIDIVNLSKNVLTALQLGDILTSEITERTEADQTLADAIIKVNNNVEAEIDSRKTRDKKLQDQIDNLSSIDISNLVTIGNLNSNLTKLNSDLQADIQAETAGRAAADEDLQTLLATIDSSHLVKIGNIESNLSEFRIAIQGDLLGLDNRLTIAEDGVENLSAILAVLGLEQNELQNSLNSLFGGLNNTVNSNSQLLNNLQLDLAAEADARVDGDDTLNEEISEVNDSVQAEIVQLTLQNTELQNQITGLQSKIEKLEAALDQEQAARISEDAALAVSIGEEAAARAAEDGYLEGLINDSSADISNISIDISTILCNLVPKGQLKAVGLQDRCN